MNKDKILGYSGLTFDDVLLVPQKSEILPFETELATYLTKSIKLNLPLISAAMDTVASPSELKLLLISELELNILQYLILVQTQLVQNCESLGYSKIF